MTLIDILSIWFPISILLYMIFGLCANDPGSTDLGNKIFFIIIAILALPITIIGIIIFGLLILYMKKSN